MKKIIDQHQRLRQGLITPTWPYIDIRDIATVLDLKWEHMDGVHGSGSKIYIELEGDRCLTLSTGDYTDHYEVSVE